MSFQMDFLNNQLYGIFYTVLVLNLKKKSCRKSKYLQSTVEYLMEYFNSLWYDW